MTSAGVSTSLFIFASLLPNIFPNFHLGFHQRFTSNSDHHILSTIELQSQMDQIDDPVMFSSNDMNCLRNKWVLVCRASGVHRLPSYQRAAAKGPWKPRDIITKSDALKHNNIWANCLAPVPYQCFPDGTDNLETYQEGYGCRFIFLHPFKSPWVLEAGLADGWIIGDGGDPNESWDQVSNWLTAQSTMQQQILSENTTSLVQNKDGNYSNSDGVQFVSDFPGHFEACITFDDFSISAAAHVAEKLNLITTPHSIIEVIKNKYKLRQVCHQIGIPVPRSLIFRLNDLFLGKLDVILDPKPAITDDAESKARTAVNNNNEIPLEIVPGQRLNLHTNEWLTDPLTNQKYTQVKLDNPQTPSEWEQYYLDKETELAQLPLQYPLVIKPFSGAGSNFVRKAADYQELIQVFRLFYHQTKGIRDSNNVFPSIGGTSTGGNSTEEVVDGQDENVDIPEEQLQLLRTKWKCWGLPDIDVSFMIEECIQGVEFDLDVLIQDSQIVYASINDNFPTAGHAQYFLEAGGIVQSGQPFKQQMAMRVMTNFILKYFHDYFIRPTNEEKFGTCLYSTNRQQQRPQQQQQPLGTEQCHVNTPFEQKCQVCQKYSGINGVWHFEGMIANNMNWAKKYQYGILSGYTQVSDDDTDDDFYVCMPIEINQRVGGSEVQCLSSICSGVEYAVDNIKIHTHGVRVPNYYSLLPQFSEMNRLGWDRFPNSQEYDPNQVFNPQDSSLLPRQMYEQKSPFQYKQDPILSKIQFPPRPVKTLVSVPLPRGYDGLSYPMANIPDGENSGPQLHTRLPLPRNLLPKLERIPYEQAVAIVHSYTQLLKLPTPLFYYPPADPTTGEEIPRWRFATSINWAPSASGKLRSNHFTDAMTNDPTYLGGILWWSPGQNVFFPPLGFDCLGWLTAGGNTPMEAHYHMLRLAAELRYYIDPIEESST